MVQLGLTFDDMHTALDLEEGLALLNRQLGQRASRRSGATVSPTDFVRRHQRLRRHRHGPPSRSRTGPTTRLLVDRRHDDRDGDLRNRPQHHQLREHGRGSRRRCRLRDGRQALVVRAEDDGPGIADIERALEDGYSTGRGLGLGLPGARRLMDQLDRGVGAGPGHRRRDVEVDSRQCFRHGQVRADRMGRGAASTTGRTGVRRPPDRCRHRRRRSAVRCDRRARTRRGRADRGAARASKSSTRPAPNHSTC